MRDRTLIETIFSDAHVVDLDFSKWDKAIEIYVIADHVELQSSTRLPIFKIAFARVTKCEVQFNHLGIRLRDASHHFQWRIDTVRIEEVSGNQRVELAGSATDPRLVIDCEDLSVQEVEKSLLDRVHPDWAKPYGALARPGIEELGTLMQSRAATRR